MQTLRSQLTIKREAVAKQLDSEIRMTQNQLQEELLSLQASGQFRLSSNVTKLQTHLHSNEPATQSLRNAFLNDNEVCGIDAYLDHVKVKGVEETVQEQAQ